MIVVTEGLAHLKMQDKKLAKLVDRYSDLTIAKRAPGFHALSKIIVNQQLSGKAAETIFSRLLLHCESSELTPNCVLGVAPNVFKKSGIAASKANFILQLAQILNNDPSFLSRIAGQSDEEAFNSLCQLNGIGPWTASIYLMSCDARLDIFPIGDGSLSRAMKKLYGVDQKLHVEKFERITKRWSPYRTIACRILWRWVDEGMVPTSGRNLQA